MGTPATIAECEGYEVEAMSDITLDRSIIDHWLEAVRDRNPLYWDDAIADEMCGGIIAPPPIAIALTVNRRWSPRRPEEVWDVHGVEPEGTPWPRQIPMEPHWILKDVTGLRQTVIVGIESEFHAPVRLGDRLKAVSKSCDVSEERTNRLGTGRSWTVEVRYFNQRDELLCVERYRSYNYNRE